MRSVPPTSTAIGPSPAAALVMVVGPSGAGKDSVIGFAKRVLAEPMGPADSFSHRLQFVRRVITRAPDPQGENHEAMDVEAFEAALEAGAFALAWQSHGHHYGIRSSIVQNLARGDIVIANVSRGVIAGARPLCPRRVVVNISASPHVLAARLAARGREAAPMIQSRLARTVSIDEAGAERIEINNDGPIEQAGQAFVGLIARLSQHP